MSAHCAAGPRPLDTIRLRRIFGIGDASPRCRRRLGRASRAQARGGSLLLTFQIGGRGSRHRRPLPDRPPTLQAFRSVLSETTSVSTRRLIKGSRSYLRRHGVQSRGAAISYHKLTLSVYRKFCRAWKAWRRTGRSPNSFAIFAFFAAKTIERERPPRRELEDGRRTTKDRRCGSGRETPTPLRSLRSLRLKKILGTDPRK